MAANDIVNSRIFCRRCGDKADIGQFEVPYVYKLLVDVLKLAGIRTTHVFRPTTREIAEVLPAEPVVVQESEEKGKEKVPEPETKAVPKKRAPAKRTAKK